MQNTFRIAIAWILLSLALLGSACAASSAEANASNEQTALLERSGAVTEPVTDEQIRIRYRALLRDVSEDEAIPPPPPEPVMVPIEIERLTTVDTPPPPPSEYVALEPEDAPGLTIQPEAILRIRVKEDPSLDGQYVVNEIGAVNLGYIGPIILFNCTEEQAAQKIRDVLISRAFRNATVNVEILRASYDRVGIAGMVQKTGAIRIGAGDAISLNDALLRAGGLRGSARGMQVRIIRGGLTNVLAAAQDGEVYPMQSSNGRPAVPRVWLRNNDKAIVFSTQAQARTEYGDKEVLVLGEVSREGPVSFSSGEQATMMRLVFKIGGFPRYANTRRVSILRRDERGVEVEKIVDVEEILDTGNPDLDVPLEHGDRIIVPARRISLF